MVEAYAPPPDTGLDILFEDPWLLVLNKPAGLLSVPGRGAEKQDCLARRVQARYPEALIVHRLDMETSGLLVMARDPQTHRLLSRAFEQRQVQKRYIAVASGLLEVTAGDIDLPLITDWPNRPRQKVDQEAGKPALTHYRVLAVDPSLGQTRVELTPVTGRTHQLRLHLLALGHPIVGDRLYAADRGRKARLLLHAEQLLLTHPHTGECLELHCPCPF